MNKSNTNLEIWPGRVSIVKKIINAQSNGFDKKAREHFHKKATETAPIINADDEGRVE